MTKSGVCVPDQGLVTSPVVLRTLKLYRWALRSPVTVSDDPAECEDVTFGERSVTSVHRTS